MKKCIFALFLFISIATYAQVVPAPGINLLHSQVMFEYPAVGDASSYQVEIFRWDSVKQLPVPYLQQSDYTTATLVDYLEFGNEYRWNYKAFDKRGAVLFTSPEYRFYIRMPVEPNLDQQRVRLIESNCDENLPGLLALDYTKAIYDRKGRPVCYVPMRPPLMGPGFFIRDLRLSKSGTITLITKYDAIELDLEGHIIWLAPNDGKVSGEASEFYHHDFCKLDNGNYMVLSARHKVLQAPNDTTHAAVEFGTIIEYDPSGNVVWHWDSDTYFDIHDLFARRLPDNTYDVSTHCNSFDISPDGKYIYLSFRDVSRLIKIEKSTGKVITSFGAKMPSGEARTANGFFHAQHSGILLHDGNLAIFNNDSIADPRVTSSVLIFTDPATEKTPSKLLWKFDCKFDTLSDGKSQKTGNVLELPNHNLLVNMGTLNRTVELGRDKKIVWDAFTEQWNSKEKKWEPFPQFRCDYASSLYPCYFTAVITDNTKSKSRQDNMNLQLFNEGTEADSYLIRISTGNTSKEITTDPVEPGKSVTVNIERFQKDEKQRLIIYSRLDERRTRTFLLPEGKQFSTLNALQETKAIEEKISGEKK